MGLLIVCMILRLPNAPSLQIYCVYGHGKETEVRASGSASRKTHTHMKDRRDHTGEQAYDNSPYVLGYRVWCKQVHLGTARL